jgi:hypothetical protein
MGDYVQAKREEIVVPAQCAEFVDAAVLRLTYLYPSVSFSKREGVLAAVFEDELDAHDLRKQMAHTLYREKIYQETLELRRRALRALY